MVVVIKLRDQEEQVEKPEVKERREAEYLGYEVRSEPLGPLGALKLPEVKARLGILNRRLVNRLDINPIKHFEVRKTYWWIIPTGIEGKFRMEIVNPTFWSGSGKIYVKCYDDGFKFVDRTFDFSINRRSKNVIDHKWRIGFWDMLTRWFYSLVSDETTLSGWVEIGGYRKDYDVTEEIPVEKAE